ncbi:MAG: hypothetical protein ACYTEZ_07650 [Planctomycetota bacterium]|jgi:hypothetical protein
MRTVLSLLVLATLVWAQDREVTACEICGGDVYQTPKSYVSGRTKYIYVDTPPHKPYCTRCQRDVNTGKLDPNDPPVLGPRDGEEDEPSDNPYAVDKFDWEKKKAPEKDEATKDAESGFGVLPWVIGIVVGLGLLIRFFLK